MVIFRGVPRTGKTTLAKALHQRLGDEYRIALIHYDNMFEMKIGKDKDRLKPTVAMGMIEDFLIEGFNLILDYSFVLSRDLTQTIQFIEKYTSKYRTYFLKPPFWEIIERDKNFPAPKGIEVLKDFWTTIENDNFSGCIEIDTHRLSIDETVNLILNDMRSSILSKGKLSVSV